MIYSKKTQVEKESPLPLYYQVQLYMEEKIKNDEWKIGSRIPSEKKLCEQFDVSRITIRKSIDNLVSDGFLKRVKGRGAIVANNTEKRGIRERLFSFYNYLSEKGLSIEIKVVNFEKVLPNKIIKSILNLKKDEKVVKIIRLRIVDSEPWYYEITHIPEKYYDVPKEDLSIDSTIQMIEDNTGYKIVKTRMYFYAGIANEENRRLLGITAGSAVQVFEAINYLDNKTPIEYSINYCKSDKILFDFEMTEDEITNFMQKERKR